LKKTCNACNLPKDVSEFSKKGNGYQSECKPCKAIRANKYYYRKQNKAYIDWAAAVEKDPHGFLAVAIIERAILDMKAGDDMTEFYESDWFTELCDIAGVNADYYGKLILEMCDGH